MVIRFFLFLILVTTTATGGYSVIGCTFTVHIAYAKDFFGKSVG